MRRLALGVCGLLAATSALAGPLSGPTTAAPSGAAAASTVSAAPTASTAARIPGFRVTRIAGGLDIPWDVQALPGGRLLITERARKRVLTSYAGRTRVVRFPAGTVWARGETGLMALEVDPQFSQNRRVYTCQGGYRSGGHDVRVIAWRLTAGAKALRYQRTLVSGLPSTSGRHGGCRLLITRSGSLLVGTGDAASTGTSQNLGNLGGKVLRVSRYSGIPLPGNPYGSSSNANARKVMTYGHRNVQGLAERANGTLWSAEHGPDRDDEINLLSGGVNYGWRPGPGYDEGVPMTFSGAQPAQWRSGSSTIATSGISWVYGAAWGDLNGSLAVATLKGQALVFLKPDASGVMRRIATPAALTRYGRLRSVTPISNDLLVTTSNGGGRDQVLRIHPLG